MNSKDYFEAAAGYDANVEKAKNLVEVTKTLIEQLEAGTVPTPAGLDPRQYKLGVQSNLEKAEKEVATNERYAADARKQAEAAHKIEQQEKCLLSKIHEALTGSELLTKRIELYNTTAVLVNKPEVDIVLKDHSVSLNLLTLSVSFDKRKGTKIIVDPFYAGHGKRRHYSADGKKGISWGKIINNIDELLGALQRSYAREQQERNADALLIDEVKCLFPGKPVSAVYTRHNKTHQAVILDSGARVVFHYTEQPEEGPQTYSVAINYSKITAEQLKAINAILTPEVANA